VFHCRIHRNFLSASHGGQAMTSCQLQVPNYQEWGAKTSNIEFNFSYPFEAISIPSFCVHSNLDIAPG
jgi:hypothetical protein